MQAATAHLGQVHGVPTRRAGFCLFKEAGLSPDPRGTALTLRRFWLVVFLRQQKATWGPCQLRDSRVTPVPTRTRPSHSRPGASMTHHHGRSGVCDVMALWVRRPHECLSRGRPHGVGRAAPCWRPWAESAPWRLAAACAARVPGPRRPRQSQPCSVADPLGP